MSNSEWARRAKEGQARSDARRARVRDRRDFWWGVVYGVVIVAVVVGLLAAAVLTPFALL